MTSERLFIAADVAEAQHDSVHELLDGLKKGVQFTKAHPKWVALGSMHLTVKFLGDVEPEAKEQIVASVDKALEGSKAFDFSLMGLGVFPNTKQPRVMWLGVDAGREKLIGLAEGVQSALTPLGFAPEKRKYHPHLTLARIKSLRGVNALMDVMQSHRKVFCGKAPLDHLTLYKSELYPDGARYTALHTWPLVNEGDADAS
jgi:RNA 2',3'-cyclic 3'-phosphodiesterase